MSSGGVLEWWVRIVGRGMMGSDGGAGARGAATVAMVYMRRGKDEVTAEI